MSMFQRLWNPDGSQTGNTSKSTKVSKFKQAEVDAIKDDQPLNPYTEIQILQQHTDIVRHLVQVDGRRFVSAGDDGTAVVWDIQYGCRSAILRGHSRPITCMLVMERAVGQFEDAFLWTASSDRLIKVWHLEDGACVQTLADHNSSVKSLIMLGDQLVCSAGEKLCLWDRSGHLLDSVSRPHSDDDFHLLISITNDRIVVATGKHLLVYVVVTTDDVREVLFVKTLPSHRETIGCLTNVSDGSFASSSLDGTIVLWTTHSLSPSRYFNSISEYIGSDCSYPFSVQHMFVIKERYVFAAIGRGFCLFDVIAGKLLAQKTYAHYTKVVHIGFIYNGTFLATCSEDGAIRLWGNKAKFLASPGSEDHSVKTKTLQDVSPVHSFLGISKDQMPHHVSDSQPMEPDLLGECLGHSGTVLMFLDFGIEGFVSCGIDGLVIAWKDGAVQCIKRTDICREMVLGVEGV